MLPTFRYHPNCMEHEVFQRAEAGKWPVCQCCGKETEYYYDTMMYAVADVDCLCPHCIADGSAAEKFDGTFIQNADALVKDQEKADELFKRTPGLISWQGEHWLCCCDDYCAFHSYVGTRELENMGIADEVLEEYGKCGEYMVEDVRPYLEKNGGMAGYLFQCLHCGKYHLWVDAD